MRTPDLRRYIFANTTLTRRELRALVSEYNRRPDARACYSRAFTDIVSRARR